MTTSDEAGADPSAGGPSTPVPPTQAQASGAPKAARTVALGDLPIVGRSSSANPVVLALHGWQRSARDFDWLLAEPALSESGVVALDLPGFGGTAGPPPGDQPWGTVEYAEALAKALDSKGWNNLVVLGHSFGGRVAVRLAARRPDLVAGLVLTGAPLIRQNRGAGKAPLVYRLARKLRKVGVLPEAVLEKARQKYGSADYRMAGPVLRPILVRTVNEHYEEDLAAIRQPVALVWGAADTAAPASQVDVLSDLLDAVHQVVAEGHGHDTPRELPGELARAVQIVLAESGAGQPSGETTP